jgi:hypothetical protein
LPNSFAIYAQDGTPLRQLPSIEDYYAPAAIWGDDSPMYCSPLGDRCAMFAYKPEFHTQPDDVPSVSNTGFVLVWSLDGTLLYTIPASAPGTAAFSPDGSRLAVAFGYPASSARIYRAEDGVLLAERSYTKGVF